MKKGGFQLLNLIITELKSHMTCFNSMPLITHCQFRLISIRFRVNSELGVLLTKTFEILSKIIMEYQIQASLFNILSFQAQIKLCQIKIEAFCARNKDFDQKYLNTGSKTQNVAKLSLDLIFYNIFWQNIKSFSQQNSKLRIHSKPDRN